MIFRALSVSTMETYMDPHGVSWSSVGMTQGCEAESGKRNLKADRC